MVDVNKECEFDLFIIWDWRYGGLIGPAVFLERAEFVYRQENIVFYGQNSTLRSTQLGH